MIPEIGIGNIGIGNVGVGQPNITSVFYIAEPAEWMLNPSASVPPAPPVTVDIGIPWYLLKTPDSMSSTK